MPVGIEAWVTQIPPVTRAWLALSVLTSVAVVSKLRSFCSLSVSYGLGVQQCQIMTPLQLYFSYKSAFTNMQLWRTLTNFFYFGGLSLDFVFHMFFLYVTNYTRFTEYR